MSTTAITKVVRESGFAKEGRVTGTMVASSGSCDANFPANSGIVTGGWKKAIVDIVGSFDTGNVLLAYSNAGTTWTTVPGTTLTADGRYEVTVAAEYLRLTAASTSASTSLAYTFTFYG